MGCASIFVISAPRIGFAWRTMNSAYVWRSISWSASPRCSQSSRKEIVTWKICGGAFLRSTASSSSTSFSMRSAIGVESWVPSSSMVDLPAHWIVSGSASACSVAPAMSATLPTSSSSECFVASAISASASLSSTSECSAASLWSSTSSPLSSSRFSSTSSCSSSGGWI